MQGVQFARRLFALLLLAIALLCFHAVYRALVTGTPDTHALAFLPPAAGAILFALSGLIAVIASGRLWTTIRLEDSSTTSYGDVRLFGRDATPRPKRRWRLALLLYVIPLLAGAAIAADYAGFLSTPVEVAAVEPETSNPPAASPAAQPAPEPPAVEPAPVEQPSATAEPPPPAPESPPPVGEETTTPPAAADLPPFTPPPALAPPPEVATLPPEPPPQTVAAPPPPALQATQAEGHRDAVVWLSVSPDGRSILSASTDHTIKLWDIETLRLIHTVGTHKDMARTALFLPDGARALTAGDDGDIVLRSLADGAPLHVFSAADHAGVNKLALSRDGTRAVSGHADGTVIAWDLTTNSAMHVMTGHGWSIAGVAISPDGSRAVSGSIDGELRLWDLDTGKLIRTWLGHERGAYGIVFSPDGRQLLTGSGDYTIKLWSLDTGRELRRFEGHSGTVYALALSPDGTRLLSGSLDGTARLWDVATGNELAQFNGHEGPVYAVAFAADGKIVTGGNDRTIRIWRPEGGDAVALMFGAPD